MKYYCKFCREPFEEPSVIDEGMGAYEYWGATGFHVDLVQVSPCCHEDFWEDVDDEFLIDREGNKINTEDL